jgi:hypothetical protein
MPVPWSRVSDGDVVIARHEDDGAEQTVAAVSWMEASSRSIESNDVATAQEHLLSEVRKFTPTVQLVADASDRIAVDRYLRRSAK